MPTHRLCIFICTIMLALSPVVGAIEFDKFLDTFSNRGVDEEEILDPEQAFVMYHEVIAPDQLQIQWKIEKGYYLYRDNFKFDIDHTDVSLNKIDISTGVIKEDPYFGQVEILYDNAVARLSLNRLSEGSTEGTIKITYQGCKEDVICYPPITKTVVYNLPATDSTGDISRTGFTTPAKLSPQDTITRGLASKGLIINVIAFLGFGLLLSFTPCVLPMIPILSGIIIGAGSSISTRRAFLLSFSYVLAMAVTYAMLGIMTGLFSVNLQATFQHPAIIIPFSAIFILLAFSMFGFFELQVPSFIQTRLSKVSTNQQSGTLKGAIVMGVLSAIIVGPCVAPPLAGALLYISQTGDALLGGGALLALGIGMGIPLIVVGTTEGHLLPRAGIWMNSIKQMFGFILLGVAIWFLERIMLGPVTLLFWALLFIVASVFMGALERDVRGWQRVSKALGLVLLIYGFITLIGVATGGSNVLKPLSKFSLTTANIPAPLDFIPVKNLDDLHNQLQQAKRQNKFVMLDFYADWCITCKEMEHRTFSDPEVRDQLKTLTLLQADVTRNDEEDKALLKQFELFGPPAILFFDLAGNELKAYRLLGFVRSNKFIQHIRQVKQL